ncbi:MAG: STAS domain-containing protein [Magnetococcales bacterium]|nr:STAS domain-containing protein [Magnetococcales bacterium]
MNHHAETRDDVVVVLFEGDIDLDSSPAARKILLGHVEAKMPVVVDLSKVTYIDSSGIASLVEAFQTSRKHGQPFALAAVSSSALRVFKLARLDTVFSIAETVEEAITGINGDR